MEKKCSICIKGEKCGRHIEKQRVRMIGKMNKIRKNLRFYYQERFLKRQYKFVNDTVNGSGPGAFTRSARP